jgi:phospholipid N-methyltransferase
MHIDHVISGLPWSVFEEELQKRIIENMLKMMHTRSTFITFAYLQGLILPASKRFVKLLQKYFATVEISKVVWKNIPPAVTITAKNPKYGMGAT